MANRIAKGESSPSVKRGGKLGSPALNPIGLSNARGNKPLYLDGNVAIQEHVTEWQKFWDNPRKVERFSQPVRSRLNG